MGQRTGRPRGRPPGSRNKKSIEREKAFAEAQAKMIDNAIPDVFDGDAHMLLTAIYKNLSLPLSTRSDAAKAAIRYERPALAVTARAADIDLSRLTDDELDQLEALTNKTAVGTSA